MAATGFRPATDVLYSKKRVFLPREYDLEQREDVGDTEESEGKGLKSTLAEYLTTSRVLGWRAGPRPEAPEKSQKSPATGADKDE